jgi:hypothetical protein
MVQGVITNRCPWGRGYAILCEMSDTRTDECVLWPYTKGCQMGYGQVRSEGKLNYCHHLSFIRHNGPIPEGKIVLHKCDTPLCLNPRHLFLGTHHDNNQDMKQKGRSTAGEKSSSRKLAGDQVREIRRRYQKGVPLLGQIGLAAEFGVSRSLIQRIIDRRVWDCLDD